MTVLRLLLGAGLVLALSGASAEARLFHIDRSRSELIVWTYRDGVAARLAHDHVVRAVELSGTVEYDPATPESASVTVEVQTASLQVDEPAMRRKLGLGAELPASDRADVEKAMRSAGQLDVAHFPSIRFVSSRITRQGGGQHVVSGTLTLRGISRDVTFPVQVELEGGIFRGRAALTLKQSSFGYQPYSAFLGAIKNRDEVTLSIDLVATP
jgi:polyisoprenoid-binding protein YceI